MSASLGQPAANKRGFHSLEGIRGVAAIFVVLMHYMPLMAPIQAGSYYLAVDLFFLMSGFVIAHAYEDKLGKTLAPSRFILMRLVRLYPLYLLGMLIAISVPALGILLGISTFWTWSTLTATAAPALLMLPSAPVPGMEDALYPLNTPAWSLFFELLVNFGYAVALSVESKQQRLRPLVILVVLFGLALAIMTFTRGRVDGGWDWSNWYVGLVRVGYSFPLGVLGYRLFVTDRLPKLRFPPWLSLIFIALLLMIEPSHWRPLYDAVCVLILFPLLVWLCVCNEPRHFIPAYSALGLMSYPIYVLHAPTQYLINRIADRVLHINLSDYAPWTGLALLLGFGLVGIVLATTFDVHVRQWLGRHIAREKRLGDPLTERG